MHTNPGSPSFCSTELYTTLASDDGSSQLPDDLRRASKHCTCHRYTVPILRTLEASQYEPWGETTTTRLLLHTNPVAHGVHSYHAHHDITAIKIISHPRYLETIRGGKKTPSATFLRWSRTSPACRLSPCRTQYHTSPSPSPILTHPRIRLEASKSKGSGRLHACILLHVSFFLCTIFSHE